MDQDEENFYSKPNLKVEEKKVSRWRYIFFLFLGAKTELHVRKWRNRDLYFFPWHFFVWKIGGQISKFIGRKWSFHNNLESRVLPSNIGFFKELKEFFWKCTTIFSYILSDLVPKKETMAICFLNHNSTAVSIIIEISWKNIQLLNEITITLALHSGQFIKGGGDKTVPIDRNEWKFSIYL